MARLRLILLASTVGSIRWKPCFWSGFSAKKDLATGDEHYKEVGFEDGRTLNIVSDLQGSGLYVTGRSCMPFDPTASAGTQSLELPWYAIYTRHQHEKMVAQKPGILL
jgi:hypothetical protein